MSRFRKGALSYEDIKVGEDVYVPSLDSGYYDGEDVVSEDDCVVMHVHYKDHGRGGSFFVQGTIDGETVNGDDLIEVPGADIFGRAGASSSLSEAKRVLRRAGYEVRRR